MVEFEEGEADTTTIVERIEAIQESVRAHEGSTGHDSFDATVLGECYDVTLFYSCNECGQRLGTVDPGLVVDRIGLDDAQTAQEVEDAG